MLLQQSSGWWRRGYDDATTFAEPRPADPLTHRRTFLSITSSWSYLSPSPRHNLATDASRSIFQDVLFVERTVGFCVALGWGGGVCAVRVYPISGSKANGLGDQGLYSRFLS